MRLGAFLALFAVVPCSIASAVTLTLNTSSTSSISPYIYGINGTINSGGFNNLTLTRAGGNRWTAYNWTNNYSNAGSDWYYENDNALDSSTTPAGAVSSTVQNAHVQQRGRAADHPHGRLRLEGRSGRQLGRAHDCSRLETSSTPTGFRTA